MPVGGLLELVGDIEQPRLGEVGAQYLQAHRAAPAFGDGAVLIGEIGPFPGVTPGTRVDNILARLFQGVPDNVCDPAGGQTIECGDLARVILFGITE